MVQRRWPDTRLADRVAPCCMIVVAALLVPRGWAEAPDNAQTSDDALSQKATDPTASLMSFQLLDWYTPSYQGVSGSSNQLLFRAAVPFTFAGTNNIFRITQGDFTSSPAGKSGLGDTQIFNLTVFGADWGRWGAGLSGSLPVGQDPFSADKWTVGPALGFVNSATKGINWGLFGQSFFSFAGTSSAANVGIVNIQPILAYQLGHGRSLSLGNSAFVYDTQASRWSSLAVGPNYGQVMTFAGYKWRPNAEVDYDFANVTGNQRWIFRIGMALLVPTG